MSPRTAGSCSRRELDGRGDLIGRFERALRRARSASRRTCTGPAGERAEMDTCG
jgi:hypothetical protein